MRIPASALVGPGCECSDRWMRLTSRSLTEVSGWLASFHPTPAVTAMMERPAAMCRFMITSARYLVLPFAKRAFSCLQTVFPSWPSPLGGHGIDVAYGGER